MARLNREALMVKAVSLGGCVWRRRGRLPALMSKNSLFLPRLLETGWGEGGGGRDLEMRIYVSQALAYHSLDGLKLSKCCFK